MEHISARLKRLRTARRWTQEELAARSGIRQGNLTGFETGRVMPSLASLQKLASVFELTWQDLIDNVELSKLTSHYVSATRPASVYPTGSLSPSSATPRIDRGASRAQRPVPDPAVSVEAYADAALQRWAEELRDRAIADLERSTDVLRLLAERRDTAAVGGSGDPRSHGVSEHPARARRPRRGALSEKA